MSTLSTLLELPREEQKARGLVYTPREIAQQPETWRGTLSLFQREQQRICHFLEGLGLRGNWQERPTVFLIGAGTSDYVARSLASLLRTCWQCEVMAYASTDLLPGMDDYFVSGTKYLWISFSRSGDSPEGVAVLQQAIERHPEIAHLIVTCNPEAGMVASSRAHELSCSVVLDDAVNDRSLVMTSSFSNLVLFGQCLAHAWSLDEYLPRLEQLAHAGAQVLEPAFTLADQLARERFPRVCLVGIGPLAAVATESALKVLEMSAGLVKTMAETTLGLRHGPMAALDRETLFICFVSGDNRRQGYAVDLLKEVGRKQVTGKRIAVGPASARVQLTPCCEEYLALELDVEDGYRTIVDIIFAQMLGLCTSIEHGLMPDAPSSGGVLTRVVQQFAIYT